MGYKTSWVEVFGYFITDERITLKDCADKFDLSYDSLRQKAALERWYEKKNQLYLDALNSIRARTLEEIQKRTEIQVKEAQLLQQEGVTAIRELGARPKTFKEARLAIKIGQQLERIALKMD